MTINVALLRKTLEFVTEHPAEWDQKVWARKTDCGTAACVAGWAVQLAGHELVFGRNSYWPREAFLTEDGETISHRARWELGLDYEQARDLFEDTNTLTVLWGLAAEYTDGEIQPPEHLQ